MNIYLKHLLSLAAALGLAIGLASCEGDQALPPLQVPEGLINAQGEIGQGTWQSPLTVFQVSKGAHPFPNVWMCGYIVGYVDSNLGAIYSETTAKFSAPAGVASNILLADTPDLSAYVKTDPSTGEVIEDTRWKHAVPVALVYDTDARYDLNLKDNPNVLGRQVCLYGETNINYFGTPAMKNTSEYKFGDQGFEVVPKVPVEFKRVSTFESDRSYLIVYQNKVAKNLSDKTKYMYTVDGALTGNVITTTGDLYSYYFESVAGGVAIRMLDGRYLLKKADNWSGFDFTENPADPGALFTVTPGEDECTFIIKNVLCGKTLQYDSNYGSFGMYNPADGKPLPQLFRKNAD